MTAGIVRAEWTKLRSVRGTAWCLFLGVAFTVGLSSLLAAVGKTDDGPHLTDEFSFVHQSMSGDGSITARVRSQEGSDEWAKAGIMIKESLTSGSPYAAMMVTPIHGVRWETGFQTSLEGPALPWLRVTRSGSTITGEVSADGVAWKRVGSVDLAGLPPSVEAGLFVTSPFRTRHVQGAGREGAELIRTEGRATFDNVTTVGGAGWRRDDVTTAADRQGNRFAPGYGTMTETAPGTLDLTGTGDVSGYGIPSYGTPEGRDTVADSLRGVQIGLMALVALGVLFAASEYRTGLARTTFTAIPLRGKVLAAKAVVLGATVFVTGLVASVAAFLFAQAILRGRGLKPPIYPILSLADGPVLRAVVGTALLLALLSVLGLGVAVLLRRAASAIASVLALVVVPQVIGAAALVPLDAEQWLNRLTPAAGLAVQETRQGIHTALGPWAGLGVLGAYTAIALGLAWWRLRRSDA